MNFEQILYEKDGPILTITLNRPDKLNAFTGQMMQEIIATTLTLKCPALSFIIHALFLFRCAWL